MAESTLGQRYERLLLLAAPLSLASLLLVFVAYALSTQERRVTARCLSEAAIEIESHKDELTKLWDSLKPVEYREGWGAQYSSRISTLFIYKFLGESCYEILNKELPQRYRHSPVDIVKEMRKDSADLSAAPFIAGGIELPNEELINVFGTSVKIELMTLVRIIQIALGPVLLLWLASLYNTRIRETILIAKAELLSEIFPHIINLYSADSFKPLKKRSKFLHNLPHVVGIFFALCRVFLLSMFLGPTVVAYIASLFMLRADGYALLSLTIGALLTLFTINTIALEFFSWHVGKSFPTTWEDNQFR